MVDAITRVAAAQFAIGTNVEENLATCLRMLDEAARHAPQLVVLPEFCNHLSWYEDKAHCHAVSVTLDGPFLAAIAERAKRHAFHVVVNCTVQRGPHAATGTSLLFGPTGALLGASDKQVLMGHENDFLERATAPGPVVETPFARIGMYACMDGVINETPRALALRGAQILCNSLNSFAPDEASLHVPVRAPENRVFVVAANKIGPLIPAVLLEPVAAATNIPPTFLHGAGESQIVAPDGTVLARAPRDTEAVIVADIVVGQADVKTRPDGTDVFAARRPELYAVLGEPPHRAAYTPGAERVSVAVYQPEHEGALAVGEVCEAIMLAARRSVALVVLPELFCFAGGVVHGPVALAMSISREVERALAAGCRRAREETGVDVAVVTSLVGTAASGARHTGVLIGSDGVRFRQAQLHASARHSNWATTPRDANDGIAVYTLAWGRLGIVVGDDALYPETFRMLALENVEVVAAPIHVLEPWEVETGLLERAAENRICLAAATRVTDAGASLLTTLWKDFTIMTPWETRPFDGHISYPRVTRAPRTPGLTCATLSPAFAENKTVSHRTHLVDGRPYGLTAAITSSVRSAS